MPKTYVRPKTKKASDGLSTNYVRAAKRKVKVPDNTLCKVTHQGVSAFFQLAPYDRHKSDVIARSKDLHIHENLADAFPTNEIIASEKFLIDTDVRMEDVPECSSAKLFLRSSGKIAEEKLENFLRENTFLLHNHVVEAINTGDETVEFEVLKLNPSRPTVKVTSNTKISFVDQSEKSDIVSSQESNDRGSASSEMEVDVDVTPTNPSVSFEEDVAGMDVIKKEAKRIITLFDTEKREIIENLYGKQFIERGNGMLLYGPPGCGKTLVSEAIANEIKEELGDQYGDVRFIEMKGSQLLSRYPGESERRIEYVFDTARDDAEDGFVVLFFDEIETLMPDRGDDQLQRHERQLTNAFLQEMNDVSDDLLVLGATNFPNKIDPAADRRFPMKVFTPPPDEEVMKEVWDKSLPDDLDTIDEDDLETLAKESLDYTPAEITDEVLGGDLQRDIVLSVANDDPISLDVDYLLKKLDKKEPETISKYINSIGTQNLEGYSELQDYVHKQLRERSD